MKPTTSTGRPSSPGATGRVCRLRRAELYRSGCSLDFTIALGKGRGGFRLPQARDAPKFGTDATKGLGSSACRVLRLRAPPCAQDEGSVVMWWISMASSPHPCMGFSLSSVMWMQDSIVAGSAFDRRGSPQRRRGLTHRNLVFG